LDTDAEIEGYLQDLFQIEPKPEPEPLPPPVPAPKKVRKKEKFMAKKKKEVEPEGFTGSDFLVLLTVGALLYGLFTLYQKANQMAALRNAFNQFQ